MGIHSTIMLKSENMIHALFKYAYNENGNILRRGYNQDGGLHGQHREGLGMLVG